MQAFVFTSIDSRRLVISYNFKKSIKHKSTCEIKALTALLKKNQQNDF